MSIIILPINSIIAQSNKPPHYRGIAAVSDQVIWISGSKGSVIKTDNGGISWDTVSPQSGNSAFLRRKDFRDIWAINALEAVIMSAGDSAIILKTVNGGKTWKTVYTNNQKGIFLDAMEINNATGWGLILGDPINGYFASLITKDFGNNWIALPNGEWNTPTDSLESFFAASGTSLCIIKVQRKKKTNLGRPFQIYAIFAGGGLTPQLHWIKIMSSQKNLGSNIIIESQKFPMFMPGGPASGCYGLSYLNQNIIAVGGNYTLPNQTVQSCNITQLNIEISNEAAHIEFSEPQKTTGGYRSGVCQSTIEYTSSSSIKTQYQIAIATGSNGTDISLDSGKTWEPLKWNNEEISGFNACAMSPNYLWLAGNKGDWKKIPFNAILPQ